MIIRNDAENGRPLQLMGHSFRVLTVDSSNSAGRSTYGY